MPESTKREFSERELDLLVAARVAAEVAKLTEERNDALQKLEVAEAASAKSAAELADLLAERERELAVTTRMEEARAALPGLPDSFFTPERASAWAALSEEDFADRLAELTAAAPAREISTRETASSMRGVAPSTTSGSAARGLFARKAV